MTTEEKFIPTEEDLIKHGFEKNKTSMETPASMFGKEEKESVTFSYWKRKSTTYDGKGKFNRVFHSFSFKTKEEFEAHFPIS